VAHDILNDTVRASQNVQVPKPHDAPALLSQILVPSKVKGNAFVVRLPVEFDNGLYGFAGEIGEVRPDRMLAAELEAGLFAT
jgi:hypothetical protein